MLTHDGKFLPLPVKPESVQPGKLYIWHVQGERMRVVRGSDGGNALITLDNDDYWHFANDLIGVLYGPITFAEPGD